MIRRFVNQIRNLLKSASGLIALFACSGMAHGEPITLFGANGLEISGDFLGFDGDYVRVGSAYGILTLDYSRLRCEGQDCPDLLTHVPEIRISGAERIGALLLPALVEGFARHEGFVSKRTELGDARFSYEIGVEGELALVQFSFHQSTSDEGFADLLTQESDIAMSVREIRSDEAQLAQDIGLGDLRSPQQARILALDGIVPITSSSAPISEISPSDLALVFSGEITRWSQLGGPDVPISLHFPELNTGLGQGFIDKILSVQNLSLSSEVVHHATTAALAAAVSRDARALGIVPFESYGNAIPLSLTGRCGLRADPTRSAVMTGDYPLAQPLFLYVPERRIAPVGQQFLRWLRGQEAQRIIRRANFVDRGLRPIPVADQGDRLAAAITAAGPEIPLTELQRMIRLFENRARVASTFRFEPGSTRLTAQSRSNLRQLARAISDGVYENEELLFVGFSDGRGPADANRDLSSARADAVSRELLDLFPDGVPNGVTVDTDAFGEALPIGCDETDWGQQMNRRVELWVSVLK